MNYRGDIQVLRGLSVLIVVLYHLQIGVFKSGFLGVDVFFVISGFLMAVLYFRKGDVNNALSWAVVMPFFARRAQRILPAYFLIVIAVLGIGFVSMNNAEYQSLATHAMYSALLVPNIGSWLDASYFNSNSFRPLLHLWSLGVEVQFYLIVPIIVALFLRSRRLVIALSVLSLIACLAFAGRSPSAAFFLLPFRLWEFMLGFLCAAIFTDSGAIKVARPQIGSLAFIALMGIAALDFGNALRHPGFVALLSALLAATILATGLPKDFEQSWLGRSFERIGEYSYSIYIVHYPIILLIAYQPFAGTDYQFIASWDLAKAIVLIVVASIACYRWVEKPLRQGRLNSPKLLGFVVAIAIICFGGKFLATTQYAGLSSAQKLVVDAVHDRTQFRCGSVYELLLPLSRSCELVPTESNTSKRYLLIGNSHADSLKTVLAQLAQENSASLRIWKDNFPLGWGKTSAQNISSEASKFGITDLIVHQSRDTLKLPALHALLEVAKQDGFMVHYIDPIPVWDAGVPKMVWDSLNGDFELPERWIGKHHELNFDELILLNKVDDEAFQRILISFAACDPRCKLTTDNGLPLYYDSHHLNLAGAQRLKPALAKIFE